MGDIKEVFGDNPRDLHTLHKLPGNLYRIFLPYPTNHSPRARSLHSPRARSLHSHPYHSLIYKNLRSCLEIPSIPHPSLPSSFSYAPEPSLSPAFPPACSAYHRTLAAAVHNRAGHRMACCSVLLVVFFYLCLCLFE